MRLSRRLYRNALYLADGIGQPPSESMSDGHGGAPAAACMQAPVAAADGLLKAGCKPGHSGSSPRAHQWVPNLGSTGLVFPGDGVIGRGRLVLCCHGTAIPAVPADKGGELEHGPS